MVKIKTKRRKKLKQSYYSIICLFLNSYKLFKKEKNAKDILLSLENKSFLLKIEKYKKLKWQLKKNKKIKLNIKEMKVDGQKLMKISIDLAKSNSKFNI